MRSLTLKLMLAFLGVSLTAIALVILSLWSATSAAFNRFLTDRGLNDYTTLVTEYYKTNHSWQGVSDYLRQQEQISISAQATRMAAEGTSPDGFSTNPGIRYDATGPTGVGVGNPPTPFVLADENNIVIGTSGMFKEGEKLPSQMIQQRTTVSVDNQVVGYVVVTGRTPKPSPFESQFLTRVYQAMVYVALGTAAVAMLMGLALSRSITRPVRDLTTAASEMATGQLKQQVPVRSKDELGELTRTFNQMSADLQHSNQLRKQMTADIAHDLRTPLSVITGYLEGLKDGVIKPSPKRFAAMYDEAIYLQRLVEDLRTLSLADAGELSFNPQAVRPGELLERLSASFQHQAEQYGIHLTTDIEKDLPPIQIDPERMLQALCNLVSNAMRYTPSGGEITLSAGSAEDRVRIEVKDTGSGIDAEVLPHVFDRFYRGDDSRHEGGSGLGLAIAKSIVELQGGKISAASEGTGKGSLFAISMPCGSSS